MRLNRFVLVQNLYKSYLFYLKITLVFLNTHNSMYTKSACIIIHGTWAQNETWYLPGGDFFEAVKSCNDEIKRVDEVVSFSWSGKLGYPAQVEAAKNLAKNMELYDSVILIAHSHGATIGMIASHVMLENSSNRNKNGKIAQFYSLGVPISQSTITSNMLTIKRFYNLFSFGDFIQTVNGTCDRTFTFFDRVANISVQLNNVHPTHGQLHHPSIGMWLLKIEDFFAQKQLGNFENFDCNYPGFIFFTAYAHPSYALQEDQSVLIDLDRKIHEWMTTAFFRGGKHNNFDD